MKIGIIGGGQLGWMMILEGRKLGYEFNCIDTDLSYPGVRIADGKFSYANYRNFVRESDVITYEFEHVDDACLNEANQAGKLKPGFLPIELKRDRSREKDFLNEAGLPVTRYYVAHSAREVKRYAKEFDSCIVKSALGGYDGKGQFLIQDGAVPQDMPDQKYVVEEFVDFDNEASVIASRDSDGRMAFHQASLNVNEGGMLLYNIAPVQDLGMREITKKLLDALNYIGTIGVEFFVRKDRVMINEFSPRVHNSGHHTLLGSSISQFEQHIRAILGLPVPEPKLLSSSGILNLIGIEISESLRSRILGIPGTQIYWYGKSPVRKRRKVGHINVVGESYRDTRDKIEGLKEIVYGDRLRDFI